MALPCFTQSELTQARRFLSSQVATMMGRKLEEGDWAKVYAAAKEIPLSGWSNLEIDIIHGNLGVEQKMIRRKSSQSIRASCGTSIMHPAGTRSIRIPDEEDATRAAREVLKQYADLLSQRTRFVGIRDRFNHLAINEAQAIDEMMDLFKMKRTPARRLLPDNPTPTTSDYTPREPDMRTGWLLWQDALREFLYFEERMIPPNPSEYYAQWVDSGGGRRKKSRNLWIYHQITKEKTFSITTEAGAKVQPYFRVPPPDDPYLYHFIAQGEPTADGLVRIWLTEVTAGFLKRLLGSLNSQVISNAIFGAEPPALKYGIQGTFATLAVEIQITKDAYEQLKSKFPGVSDEHMVQQFLHVLSSETK